ncbi:thiolase family protein [Corynebacterium comes]|uniref:3-oxoadipyl-CoA/3-oxo-5,6-dehydrosuberyl-CoA thiolase n=1 Tax=Corynebacterium comes TaxID=2675218 RepID=A0A6B8VQN1_9CORY|nr:acetyl-CoA C-acyltransferase [Corynebacterium comes]QGU05369.1 3-oxoadipyl-CoA/3-oxo-5,6-dehydrosuberyl-CoA thiolase [Corynebacterium comes]
MTQLNEAFLVSGARTPVGKYGGALSSVRPDDLAALVIRQVVTDAGIDPADVDEVILGNANGAGEENRNVARMAWLLAGFPDTVPGMTVNRLCASGMSAISVATAMVRSGQADIIVAGGVESMSRAPWVTEKPKSAFAKPGETFDTSIGWRFVNPVFAAQEKMTLSMPETAEEVARQFNVTREQADQFAVASQAKAAAAMAAGHFDAEIVPVEVTDRKGNVTAVTRDEGPRPGTTTEALAKLRPVVDRVVTAGNSSTLNDGASAVIVASEAAVERYGLTPRARVVASTQTGLHPSIMGMGPVEASRMALERAGWSMDSLDAVELNEAFATQSVACMKEMGVDPEIVNAWGGAIALGHPLGSSGARITVTLLNRMEQGDLRRGLATMCVGVGQGTALLVEKV